jgi:hypothetical protein
MHLRIIKKFNIFLGTLPYMFRHRVVPSSGSSKFLAKIYTQLWHKNVTSKSELKLIKLIKTAK